jgi:cobalt/nickel transport system permease protein
VLRLISILAKNSKIVHIHPMEKILLAVMPIILMGFSKSIYPLVLNILLFAMLHIACRNPFKIVWKFTLAAAIFAGISSITLIFDYGWYYCAMLVLRTFSSGICLSYLALSTPMDDILYLCSKNTYLKDISDIAKSMERFIMLIEDEYVVLYNAIKSRNGFSSFSLKIRNTGKMAGLLFINTMKRWQDIKNAINTRCYRGDMSYLQKEFDYSMVRMVLILLYNGCLLYFIF